MKKTINQQMVIWMRELKIDNRKLNILDIDRIIIKCIDDKFKHKRLPENVLMNKVYNNIHRILNYLLANTFIDVKPVYKATFRSDGVLELDRSIKQILYN